jgi:boron transporter
MYRRTGEFFGVNEALFSSALAAMVFSILGAQPLTIVGITGLISLFNFTIYDIIKLYDVSIYPQFICWTAIWAAIFHWIVAIFNFCDYMRYVTDFSSESFGMYVGIIYCSEFGPDPAICAAWRVRSANDRLVPHSQGG